MLIDQCPAIRKAALDIAYDNGMVNRLCTEKQFLRRANAALFTRMPVMGVESF